MKLEPSSALGRLGELGQSVWIDYLSRDLLESGELARLVQHDAVVGVTSNPSIFEQALAYGDAYDEQLRELFPSERSAKDVFLELACRDVADACDVLRPVWERTGRQDGYVSIEVDPNLAHKRLAQFEEAQQLHERIARPNLYVKIPATRRGVEAIEDSITWGRSINVTLIFSIDRYVETARAYIRGLTRLRAAGGDVASVHSVASFFVSRVDTETDRRLDELGAPAALKGRLAIANAKLAYACYRQLFSPENELWRELAAAGAQPQRCLWASTSTKNPAYRDVRYVEELIGPATVNTMPESTLRAFADHGEVASTLERGLEDAQRLLGELKEAGIDYNNVVETLEAEGIAKFSDAFAKLLARLEAKKQDLMVGAGDRR
jgi:transaldolase